MDLLTSFPFLAAMLAISGALISYFLARQFLLRMHQRKGERALKRGDHLAALRSFARAESLWQLNVTRQTYPSYLDDLALLAELLDGLESAARHEGIVLAVADYREALQFMRSVFDATQTTVRRPVDKSHVPVDQEFRRAQSSFRRELRSALRSAASKTLPRV